MTNNKRRVYKTAQNSKEQNVDLTPLSNFSEKKFPRSVIRKNNSEIARIAKIRF